MNQKTNHKNYNNKYKKHGASGKKHNKQDRFHREKFRKRDALKPTVVELDTKVGVELGFETESGKLGRKIYRYLLKEQKKGASTEDIIVALQKKDYPPKETKIALRILREEGRVVISRRMYFPASKFGMQPAIITRIKESYGYANLIDSQDEVFIPGRYLCGSLPGERVLVSKCPSDRRFDSEDRFMVDDILEMKEDCSVIGTVKQEERSYYIYPDRGIDFGIRLNPHLGCDFKVGDKVQAVIVTRGERHSEMRAQVVQNYGDSQIAAVSAEAILDELEIIRDFPEDVLYQAKQIGKKQITEKDLSYREDWRHEIVFTIDAATSKDLDDAVSLIEYPDHYELGVHIADVSHYVKHEGVIDKEAFARGTSVYYADQVVPMLPKELSNGICSLNPNEDRLTFSAILTVGKDGQLLDFDFRKTVICSRVKGVYSEINQILNHTASDEILQKYAGLTDTIFKMKELADILTANKYGRGAPEIDKPESKIILGEDGKTKDIVLRERGASEIIIEEFMLMANEAAAKAAKMKHLPFVYRIHEPPTPDKLEILHEAAEQLGFNAKGIEPGMQPKVLSALLKAADGTSAHDVMHTIALRSMSKARYSESPVGHYGLVLDDYAHFTSPIRRYPDLTIHRILSEFVTGKAVEQVERKYKKFVKEASEQSSNTELKAMSAERRCSDCYKAEYMKDKIGQVFEATVSSVMSYGLYVELPNTVEGLIHQSRLPGSGEYQMLNAFLMKDMLSGKSYKIGDTILVRCTAADVGSGRIDFEVVEPDEI